MPRKSNRSTWRILATSFALLLSLHACQAQPTGPALSITPIATRKSSPASSVTLALMGDIMLGRGVKASRDTFAYLETTLQTADLALANLESPLTHAAGQSATEYMLCAKPENVIYLVMAGFDLLSLANNHHLDCGEAGLAETQITLKHAGISAIGPGREAVFRQLNELSVAFLAFDATTSFDLEAAADAVQDARTTGASVVVSIHWGAEYQSGANTAQKQIARRLIESGAALIWGHHPHVLQPAVRIDSGLVLFSLGNAVFDQAGLANTRQSALVLVALDQAGANMVRAIPFVYDLRGSRITQPDPEDASNIMQYFKLPVCIFEGEMSFWENQLLTVNFSHNIYRK